MMKKIYLVLCFAAAPIAPECCAMQKLSKNIAKKCFINSNTYKSNIYNKFRFSTKTPDSDFMVADVNMKDLAKKIIQKNQQSAKEKNDERQAVSQWNKNAFRLIMLLLGCLYVGMNCHLSFEARDYFYSQEVAVLAISMALIAESCILILGGRVFIYSGLQLASYGVGCIEHTYHPFARLKRKLKEL